MPDFQPQSCLLDKRNLHTDSSVQSVAPGTRSLGCTRVAHDGVSPLRVLGPSRIQTGAFILVWKHNRFLSITHRIVIRTLLSNVMVIAHPNEAAGGRRALARLQRAGLA